MKIKIGLKLQLISIELIQSKLLDMLNKSEKDGTIISTLILKSMFKFFISIKELNGLKLNNYNYSS